MNIIYQIQDMKTLWPFVVIVALFYGPALLMSLYKDRQDKYTAMRNSFLRKCYQEESQLDMQRFTDELASRPNSINVNK